jgi:hypothetical protein
MSLLMFCVRPRRTAGTCSMKADRAVAFPTSWDYVSQSQRLFDRDYHPPANSLARVGVSVPLPNFAFVDLLFSHCGRRLPVAGLVGNLAHLSNRTKT